MSCPICQALPCICEIIDRGASIVPQEGIMKKINDCKSCDGYGVIQYFDGGGDISIRTCKICKGKISKQKESER